jgi:DNA-binding transcriptional ArsR family regulator
MQTINILDDDMSRHGSTKEKILKLVEQGDNNLSKISSTLNLSPSTVSKHLHDLEEEGRIERQDNQHFKKWKFYSIGRTRPQEQYNRGIGKGVMIAIAAFLLLTISATAYVYSRSSVAAQIPIRITDPPEVPAGTQALYINYSSLEAEIGSGRNLAWVTVNSSGRLDLMNLINYTQLIGELDIAPGSTISRITFNITSASIMIDNVTYAVHLLDQQVIANVENGDALNSSSGVLLDLSPIVTAEYAQNSTTFTMLPFLRAVVAHSSNGQESPANGGFQAHYPLMPYYRSMFSGADLKLIVTNVTLLSEGNETVFNITISNTGNSSIGIEGVVLYANMLMFFNGNRGAPQGMKGGALQMNETRQMNCSADLNGPEGPMMVRWCRQSNSSVVINESAVLDIMPYLGKGSIGMRLHGPVNNIMISNFNAQTNPGPAFMLSHPPAINFLVNENGTLSLPAPEPRMDNHTGMLEYVLNSGSSVTLTYKGRLGGNANMLNGNIQSVSIITDRGITRANITSS